MMIWYKQCRTKLRIDAGLALTGTDEHLDEPLLRLLKSRKGDQDLLAKAGMRGEVSQPGEAW